MGDICSKYLGVATRVLVGSQHGSAGPVRPVDEICVDGEPVEVPRSGFNYDLKKHCKRQRTHVRSCSPSFLFQASALTLARFTTWEWFNTPEEIPQSQQGEFILLILSIFYKTIIVFQDLAGRSIDGIWARPGEWTRRMMLRLINQHITPTAHVNA